MRNAEIALHFDELADLYELDGAIVHRGVDSIDALKAAAESEQIRDLRGFGARAEETILQALAAGEDGRQKPRLLLSKALQIAEALRDALREHPACERIEIAGSARRWAETCKD